MIMKSIGNVVPQVNFVHISHLYNLKKNNNTVIKVVKDFAEHARTIAKVSTFL